MTRTTRLTPGYLSHRQAPDPATTGPADPFLQRGADPAGGAGPTTGRGAQDDTGATPTRTSLHLPALDRLLTPLGGLVLAGLVALLCFWLPLFELLH